MRHNTDFDSSSGTTKEFHSCSLQVSMKYGIKTELFLFLEKMRKKVLAQTWQLLTLHPKFSQFSIRQVFSAVRQLWSNLSFFNYSLILNL